MVRLGVSILRLCVALLIAPSAVQSIRFKDVGFGFKPPRPPPAPPRPPLRISEFLYRWNSSRYELFDTDHVNSTITAGFHLPPLKHYCDKEKPLRLWGFRNWMSYYKWRWSISPDCARKQPIQPCVLSNGSWQCLPKLIVIGATKAGTTGLRAKLTATGQFYTKLRRGLSMEGHLWDKAFNVNGQWMANAELADRWAKTITSGNPYLEWSDLVDRQGYAKMLSFEVTPSYFTDFTAHDVQRMLQVNPDAHFLLLARDPTYAFLSAREMNICQIGRESNPSKRVQNTQCGVLGCDTWVAMYPELPPKGPERKNCKPENIPCEAMAQGIKHLFVEGMRVIKRHDDPSAGFVRFYLQGPSKMLTAKIHTPHSRWRYASILHQEWIRVVPEHQLHVMQSEFLWEEPDMALKRIAELLKTRFNVSSVDNVRTKPQAQLICGCPQAEKNIHLMRETVQRCNLRDAVACAHLHSNAMLSRLMNSTFGGDWHKSPVRGWNRGLTEAKCNELGFFVDKMDETFEDTIEGEQWQGAYHLKAPRRKNSKFAKKFYEKYGKPEGMGTDQEL